MAISAGERHTCALLVRFRVVRSGGGDLHQGGVGPHTTSNTRAAAPQPPQHMDWLSPGDTYSQNVVNLSIKDELPSSPSAKEPHAFPIPTPSVILACCFPQDDATVKCWGWNANAQLGLGDTSNRGAGANGHSPASPPTAHRVLLLTSRVLTPAFLRVQIWGRTSLWLILGLEGRPWPSSLATGIRARCW